MRTNAGLENFLIFVANSIKKKIYRFSHGELISYIELKEYKEPDFTLMQKSKYPVLVKQNDRIWYKGRIVSSNFTDKSCKVKLDQSKKEISCDFEDVLPVREGNTSFFFIILHKF